MPTGTSRSRSAIPVQPPKDAKSSHIYPQSQPAETQAITKTCAISNSPTKPHTRVQLPILLQCMDNFWDDSPTTNLPEKISWTVDTQL